MRLPVNRFAALTFTTILIAIGAQAGARDKREPVSVLAPPTGPAADYPMVLGEPFEVDGVTYTPQDKLNFDQVGYAGRDQGAGITIAHRTMPLPSYAEVTSLDSGRTILVRVSRRGPMAGPNIVDLSPAAAAQLGVTDGRTPIRIRRVNPPEPERAALREGREAPLRMDTPKSLVAVLRHKLEPGATPVLPPMPKPEQAPSAQVAATKAAAPAVAVQSTKPPKPPKKALVSASSEKAMPAGSLIVQIGAFSSEAKSSEIAGKLGASVAAKGGIYRVRMGPFSSRGQAEAALAKAHAAGYSDARIQHAY
jgi:rare lipoprotein A